MRTEHARFQIERLDEIPDESGIVESRDVYGFVKRTRPKKLLPCHPGDKQWVLDFSFSENVRHLEFVKIVSVQVSTDRGSASDDRNETNSTDAATRKLRVEIV